VDMGAGLRAHDELGDVIPGTLNRVPGVTHTEGPTSRVRARDSRATDASKRAFAIGYSESASDSGTLGRQALARLPPQRSQQGTAPAPESHRARGPRIAVGPGPATAPGPAGRTPASAASGRRRVEQHGLSHRAGLAAEHGPGHSAVGARGAPPRRSSGAARLIRVRGIEPRSGSPCRGLLPPTPSTSRRGQLVETVIAVEDQGRAAAAGQHAGDHRAHRGSATPTAWAPGRAGFATGRPN